MIKKLDENSILAICVNQIIVDLSTCIKELIENALDAGATKIEVYLDGYGVDKIEVKDNGSGINEDNIEKITKKGATSKLQNFKDLQKITTYGFRGEALNAISRLSKFQIITNSNFEDCKALKLTFNQKNEVKSKESTSHQRGTSIQIKDLFFSVPVRHNEFKKQSKQHFNRFHQNLQEYCLLAKQAQIKLYHKKINQDIYEEYLDSGAPQENMFQKVQFVYGYQVANCLGEIKLITAPPIESFKSEIYLIKSIESGSARTNSFLKKTCLIVYINNRPVNASKKMLNVFNDIYKQFNERSSYFAILNLVVPDNYIDFNMSPDKRDVCLKDELIFCVQMKQQIMKTHMEWNTEIRFFDGEKKKKKNLSKEMPSEQIIVDDQDNEMQNQLKKRPKSEALDNEKVKHAFELFQNKSANIKQKNQNILFKPVIKPPNSVAQNVVLVADNNQSVKSEYQEDLDDEKQQVDIRTPQIQQQKPRKQSQQSIKMEEEVKDLAKSEIEEEKNYINNINNQNKVVGNNNNNNGKYNLIQAFQKVNNMNDSKLVTKNQQFQVGQKLNIFKPNQQMKKKIQEINIQAKENLQEKLTPVKLLERVNNQNILQNRMLDNMLEIMTPNFKQNFVKGENIDLGIKKNAIVIQEKKEFMEEDIDDANYYEDDIEEEEVFSDVQSVQEDNMDAEKQVIFVDSNSFMKQMHKKEDNSQHKFTDVTQKMDFSNLKGKFINSDKNESQSDDQKTFDAQKYQSHEAQEIQQQQEKIQDIEMEDDIEAINSNDWEKVRENFGNFNPQDLVKINKESFKDLKVLGQQWKAIIFGIWKEHDQLYIFDQHAVAEKTSFEKFIKENKYSTQLLFIPIKIVLSNSEGAIVEEEEQVFKRNGFGFKIENQGDNKKVIIINKIPVSKNIQFDQDDFLEILHILENNKYTLKSEIVPTKVRKVLAMKACRLSIKFGTVLSLQEQKILVEGLSDLAAPWNCPHGRPTMLSCPSLKQMVDRVQIQRKYDFKQLF